jgi:hypothetical protein
VESMFIYEGGAQAREHAHLKIRRAPLPLDVTDADMKNLHAAQICGVNRTDGTRW